MEPLEIALLIGLGLAVGTYSGAVGAGGGFLLTPLLLFRHGDASPAAVAMAALTVVIMISGLSAVTAARAGRIDRPVAGVLTAVALPAGLMGAIGTSLLPRDLFAIFFGGVLLVIGLYLAWRPAATYATPLRGGWERQFTDGEGDTFHYHVPVRAGLIATGSTAFLSALAGIGGGLIYTPLATRVMRIPHALAVPIAQTVNTGMATMVVAFHLVAGNAAAGPMGDVPALGIGVLISVPLGRRVNRRLGEGLLSRLLAAGLLVVAARTVLLAL